MRSVPFISLFFALTLLPVIQMVTHIVPVTPINENRNLAPRPTLETPLNRIPRVTSDWFNDHFGLRPLLIRLKTQIDYSLFKMSDRVLVGKDGWLFYRSTVNAEEPQVDSRLRDGWDAKIVAGIRAFSDALESEDIHTVLVINMMSDRFYPDKLPEGAVRRPEHPEIDRLTRELGALPNVRYVDSMAILKDVMKSNQIFHKTDFHWTDVGGFFVGKSVVDLMSKAEGLPKSAWSHPLEIEMKRSSGGIANFMPLFFPPSEITSAVKPTYVRPPDFKPSINVGIFEYVSTARLDAPGYLSPVLLVGDSFLDGMLRAGLDSVFTEVSRIRWQPGIKISAIAENLPANIRWCVIQFIEVNQVAMDAFADSDDVAKAVNIIKRRKLH